MFKNVNVATCEQTLPKVCNLKYGTLIDKVPAGSDCVYMKVKKKTSQGLSVSWETDHCVLLNLTYGTLRQIPGHSPVRPVSADLNCVVIPRARMATVLKYETC